VSIEVPEVSAGLVIEQLAKRKGELKDMKSENGIAFLEFEAPTRGLIGYRSRFITDTKGMGIMNTLLLGYKPFAGELTALPHGSLIAHESGKSLTYGLVNAQERGDLFIGPAIEVYEGMVVGENAKAEDMVVNVCKEKKLSNMRSKGDGAADPLHPARQITLETAIEYIGDDELVEVTPASIRIRKRFLKDFERRRAGSTA
jgi:GTP-binding protein